MTEKIILLNAAAAAVRYFVEDGKFRVGLYHPAWRDVRGTDAQRIIDGLRGNVWYSGDKLLRLNSLYADENILRIWINDFDPAANNPDGKAVCNGADLIPDQRNPEKYKRHLTAAVFHDVGLGGRRVDELAAYTGLSQREIIRFWNALYGAEVQGLEGRASRGVMDWFARPWLWLKRKFFVVAVVLSLALAGCSGCTFFLKPMEIVDGSDVYVDVPGHGVVTNRFISNK